MVPTYLQNLWGLEIRHGIFFEVYFWSRDFLGFWYLRPFDHRPIRLTQCCTQFKSPGVKILCVLYLHHNVAFTFNWYGNSWNKMFYPQRVWIGYIGLSLQFEIQSTLLGIALSGILPYCHFFFFLLPGCEWKWKGRGTSCIRRECAKVGSVWYYYNKYYLWIISIELLRQSVSTFCLQSNLMFILICLSELCNYISLMKSKFVCSLFKMTD